MKKYLVCMFLLMAFTATGFSQNQEETSTSSTTNNEDDGDLVKKVGCTVVKWGDDVADYAKKLPAVGPSISTTIKQGTTPANQTLGCPKPNNGNSVPSTSTAKQP